MGKRQGICDLDEGDGEVRGKIDDHREPPKWEKWEKRLIDQGWFLNECGWWENGTGEAGVKKALTVRVK